MSSAISTGDSLRLHSRRMVTASGCMPATVRIEEGRFVEVTSGNHCPKGAEDLGNLVVSPGCVDSHVHCNEPGNTAWEGFATATAAAAAGGVTAVIDMPLNSLPVTTNVTALEEKRERASGKSHVDVGFFGGLTPESGGELEELSRSGVLGIKVFLCPSGLDEFPHVGRQELLAAFEILGSLDLPLLAHAELVDESDEPGQTVLHDGSYQEWLDSRPPRLEQRAIEKIGDCARVTGAHAHVVHVASTEALETLERQRRQGARLSAETCPHYLYSCSEEIPQDDPRFKCAPPIRTQGQREGLRRAVERGLISTIGSDHSPCPPELKDLPMSRAWGGISGIQWSLPVTWTAFRQRGASFEDLSNWLAAAPATLFGLDSKGAIAPGLDADLVVWDPDEPFVVTADQMFDRHRLTPYAGHELFGRVHRTYLRGRLVFQDGQLDPEPSGLLLDRRTTARPGGRRSS